MRNLLYRYFLCLIFLLITSCSNNRNIRYNYLPFSEYPIQGLDVSHHQGSINWQKVKMSRFRFVYVKATEGEDFVDKRFKYNFYQSRKNGFLVGAYHFFSFNKSGAKQASNFISTVPKLLNTLPPVIDLEYMGHSSKKNSQARLHRELKIFITHIEQHYEVQPILYTNNAFFNRYLKGSFTNYAIWFADYSKKPKLEANRRWLLWQYSDHGKVAGISEYVDFNVFNGTESDLLALVKKK